MRSEDKTKLNPVSEPKTPPKSEAEKHAREQLKRERERTQKFKRDYFDYYDDVKVGRREDWQIDKIPRNCKKQEELPAFYIILC